MHLGPTRADYTKILWPSYKNSTDGKMLPVKHYQE